MSTIFSSLGSEIRKSLQETTRKILKPGRGILAADESPFTIGTQLKKIGVENSAENRQCYRQMLFTAEPCMSKSISGVILHEETVYQKTEWGKTFPKLLEEKGILPGIKLDLGTARLHGSDGETISRGLDSLGERCQKFKKEGCYFAKWRSTLRIKRNTPSSVAIRDNASDLARYASICQWHGIVPIVEPEVLADGDHDVNVCLEVTKNVLSAVIKELRDHRVSLEHIILKPNMVTPGNKCKDKCGADKIARETVGCLTRVIPPAVPGIFFLSGGMGEEEATVALNDIVKFEARKPWMLSFCYGRALQASALSEWGGKAENVKKAQKAFLARAKALSEATLGVYKEKS